MTVVTIGIAVAVVVVGVGFFALYRPWSSQVGDMGRHSAERIVPELQHIEVGDLVPLGPGENAGMRVQEFVPNTSILLWDEKNQTRVVPRLAGANQRNVAASEPSLGGPRGFTEVPRLGAMSSPDWRRAGMRPFA